MSVSNKTLIILDDNSVEFKNKSDLLAQFFNGRHIQVSLFDRSKYQSFNKEFDKRKLEQEAEELIINNYIKDLTK